MANSDEEWRPGSFTKNYSWGPSTRGLIQLHEAIRVGFDNQLLDVPRNLFRARITTLNRPDYIPMNFFLFNKIKEGVDHIVADELVFQAINFPHSKRFDYLAIFAFNLSMVGTWKGAKSYQSRPALWANHYVIDRLGPTLGWDHRRVTANDIETFVSSDSRYHAVGARKLATNLAYLYSQAGLDALRSKKAERWWVDALFLTLDRVLETRSLLGQAITESNYESYLIASGFFQLSGTRSIEKDLASKHLVNLYRACGARARFDSEAVRERTAILLDEIVNYVVNNPDPIAAIHRTNLRIVKSLPRVCALLARYAGFDTLDLDDLENLDTSTVARENIERAIKNLQSQGISPNISSDELIKILRGE